MREVKQEISMLAQVTSARMYRRIVSTICICSESFQREIPANADLAKLAFHCHRHYESHCKY